MVERTVFWTGQDTGGLLELTMPITWNQEECPGRVPFPGLQDRVPVLYW